VDRLTQGLIQLRCVEFDRLTTPEEEIMSNGDSADNSPPVVDEDLRRWAEDLLQRGTGSEQQANDGISGIKPEKTPAVAPEKSWAAWTAKSLAEHPEAPQWLARYLRDGCRFRDLAIVLRFGKPLLSYDRARRIAQKEVDEHKRQPLMVAIGEALQAMKALQNPVEIAKKKIAALDDLLQSNPPYTGQLLDERVKEITAPQLRRLAPILAEYEKTREFYENRKAQIIRFQLDQDAEAEALRDLVVKESYLDRDTSGPGINVHSAVRGIANDLDDVDKILKNIDKQDILRHLEEERKQYLRPPAESEGRQRGNQGKALAQLLAFLLEDACEPPRDPETGKHKRRTGQLVRDEIAKMLEDDELQVGTLETWRAARRKLLAAIRDPDDFIDTSALQR